MRNSLKSTLSKKESDPETLVDVLFVAAVWYFSEVLFSWHLDLNYPKTAIGREGLEQVTNYLERWFAYGLIKAVLIAGACLIAGWFDNWFKNRHEKIKPPFKPVVSKYIAVIFALVSMYYSFSFCRFDMQTEKNGYKGLNFMKTASLLSDCEKDLKEQKTASARIKLGSMVGEQVRVGSSYIRQYSICDTDKVIVSQVSKFDKNRLGDGYSGYLTHEVEQFIHSGFIASIDGKDTDITDDYEQLFTIEVKDGNIVRSTAEYESDLRNFTFVCVYNGTKETGIAAEGRTEFPICTFEGAEYYLEAMTYKGYTRVSNTLVI